MRGLATLRQSITNTRDGFAIPAMTIDDTPRFVWRGVMIDVARHFYSLPTIKRQIDAMERVKLNVLHLHLSDNEGFRLESRLYPKLHTASSPDFYVGALQRPRRTLWRCGRAAAVWVEVGQALTGPRDGNEITHRA